MAAIAIHDLRPVGYNLLFDSESYMTDLTDDELGIVAGGKSSSSGPGVTLVVTVVVGTIAAGFAAAALLDRYF
ncbi:MAG: hypothetical protein RID09_23690 [Coleofasciculus sp. G1-WW12-02]|uniref:hypothetical protein n=1 Tax=Coleofasciculus sp. G1-WW12-02 TaxID=3068483 RepID=UPI0032F4ECA9